MSAPCYFATGYRLLCNTGPVVQVRAQKLGDLALGADRLGRLLKVASVPVLGLPGDPDGAETIRISRIWSGISTFGSSQLRADQSRYIQGTHPLPRLVTQTLQEWLQLRDDD